MLNDGSLPFYCSLFLCSKTPPSQDHKNTFVKGVDSFRSGKLVGSVKGRHSFAFRFEHFGGRFKPWKVCLDHALVARLGSIASQHARHWPPTKLKSFQTYCRTFDAIHAKALLEETSTAPFR